jgi:hypothetical protein
MPPGAPSAAHPGCSGLRVELAGVAEKACAEIHPRNLEVALEMQVVVSTAIAEIRQGGCGDSRVAANGFAESFRLVAVVGWAAQDRPEPGLVIVQAVPSRERLDSHVISALPSRAVGYVTPRLCSRPVQP